jgi:hypothetical protein
VKTKSRKQKNERVKGIIQFTGRLAMFLKAHAETKKNVLGVAFSNMSANSCRIRWTCVMLFFLGVSLVNAAVSLPPVVRIAPMSFLTFSNLTNNSVYQLQQSVAWYWSNQPVSFTATNSVYTQMVAGVAVSGDYRLALSPVPAQAFATAEVTDGSVVGATVTSGGSGYVTTPAVRIVGGGGSNATAVVNLSGEVVTNITITSNGIGYTNPPRVEIAPPPAAAVSPTVLPMMRLDHSAAFLNFQIQFTPDLGGPWANWPGGSVSLSGLTISHYLFITNGVGFFRLQYAP